MQISRLGGVHVHCMLRYLLFTLTILFCSIETSVPEIKNHQYVTTIWRGHLKDAYGVTYDHVKKNCRDMDALIRLTNEAMAEDQSITLQQLTDLYDEPAPTMLLENFLIKAYWVKQEIFPIYQAALQQRGGEQPPPAYLRNKVLFGSFEGLFVFKSFLQNCLEKLPDPSPEAILNFLRPHVDVSKKSDLYRFYTRHEPVIPLIVWKQILDLAEKNILPITTKDTPSLTRLAKFIEITPEQLVERTQAEIERIRAILRKQWETAAKPKVISPESNIQSGNGSNETTVKGAQKGSNWFMYAILIVLLLAAIIGLAIYFKNSKKSSKKEEN